MKIKLDRKSTAPLYLQLADCIRAKIASGELRPGEKLPTVRSLFEQTGLSDGTIRHAYDLLAREGTLTLTQGRGTFVTGGKGALNSREAIAMNAIDELLDKLSSLSFSPREIQMFFTIKLNQRDDHNPLTPVALVDCNPEALNEAAQQLSAIPGIELTEFLLDDIRRTPMQVLNNFALIITTQNHALELSTLINAPADKLGRVVLSATSGTIAALSRIEAGQGTGILCQSARFESIVKTGMRVFPHLRLSEVPAFLMPNAQPLRSFLEDKQALIVSPNYLSYLDAQSHEALSAFVESGGLVIPYHHQIDQGSMLHIEERIAAL